MAKEEEAGLGGQQQLEYVHSCLEGAAISLEQQKVVQDKEAQPGLQHEGGSPPGRMLRWAPGRGIPFPIRE